MSDPSARFPLEPSSDELRSLLSEATDYVVRHLESIADQPSHDVAQSERIAASLHESRAPEEARSFGELLDLLFDTAIPASMNSASGGYMAYVPGGGIVHSAVADFIADAVNRYVGLRIGAPALVELEANTIRWFCDFVGYPEGAGGILTSGGSLANFSAIVTAREARSLDTPLERVTVYVSDQAHHSVRKASVLAGVPAANVRELSTDNEFRIDCACLEDAIATDRTCGMVPIAIVANAGTTNSGAIDDLHELADLCRRHSVWLHVDAAYGGFFALTERGAQKLSGLEQADSITLDPHKGLFLPYGTGSLLVKDPAKLYCAHSFSADYVSSSDHTIDFGQMSPEQTRDFRGLRVWLPLKMLGVAPFREALDEKLDLAEWLARELRQVDNVEVMFQGLSTVLFRARGNDESGSALDELNQKFLVEINAQQRCYLSGTRIRGAYALRACILCFRTHQEHVEACLDAIRVALKRL